MTSTHPSNCCQGGAGPFSARPRHFIGDEPCCGHARGPFTPAVQFDLVDGQHVPKPCCGRDTEPSLDVDGYGWPPIDGPWTLGDPFEMQMSTGSGVEEYPGPAGPLGYVYVAGPMRGKESFNFPAFHKAADVLREQGWTVFNPAEMDEANGFDFTGLTGDEDVSSIGFSLREALAADLAFITERADAVAVLPGWENSTGARAEVATARALGIPVFDAFEGPARPIGDDGQAIDFGVGSYWVDSSDGEPPANTTTMLDKAKEMMRDSDIELPGMWEKGDGEVKTVSATGGVKGVKPEQYDQIPVGALAELARHFGAGARKYAAHNFRKGYEWSKNYNALMRHMQAFWGGEDYDRHKDGCAPDCVDHLPESKHVTAAAWHALVLATFMDEHPEFDDRYKPEEIA